MKTFIIYLVVIVAIGSCFYFLYSQKEDHDAGIVVVVLLDVTDSAKAMPDINAIGSQLNLDSDPWSEKRFRYVPLNEFGLNAAKEIQLRPAVKWLSNEISRQQEVERFKKEVQEILISATEVKTGRSNSSLYLPMAKELVALQQSPIEKKILIVYSDLMENTSTISLYRPENLRLLATNPSQMQKEFESTASLPNLQGIEIYFVFQPTTIESDTVFGRVSEFYATYLKKKGAMVHVSADI